MTRPLIISILLVSIIFLCLSLARRRKAILAYQEQARREHEAEELGAASGSHFYMLQYAHPPGEPLPMGSTYSPQSHRRSSYHPSLYAPRQANVYPSTSTAITTTTFEQSRQSGATLGSTYIPAQDANADDVPTVPPPPYTPQLPK